MNPLHYARIISGYSLVNLSKKLNLSKQYITRAEQGLYETVNPRHLEFVMEEISKTVDGKITADNVIKLLEEWKEARRKQKAEEKELEPLKINEGSTGSEIFRTWRERYWISTHSFCVDMCLHPAYVARYEEGDTKRMPESLLKVLWNLNLIDAMYIVKVRR
jgi:transcriptional regulator with XRE-family HTH domain